MDEAYYTIDEVAERLKVTRKTVYNWMRAGLLAYVQVGGRRRITDAQLRAFIRQGAAEHAEAGEEQRSPALVAA